VNTSINKIRSRKFTESIDNEALHIGYADNAFDAMDAKVLMKMLESLPVGYRMVFNLFAVEGYSHKEIAELLNIDEGTSRSQLAKARKTLQDMIEKKGVIQL
jgi:RNA polymerase sigma-70 factor (ECF subfamily)